MPPKAPKGSRQKKAMFSGSKANKLQPTKPPAPFALPSASLEPFIETLDKKHIYILSLDTQTPSFKKNIFIIPIMTNTFLAIILLYRIYTVIPYYFEMASGVSEWTSASLTLSIIMERFFNFAMDYFLYTVILPWPKEFLLGKKEDITKTRYSSAVTWRIAVPFQDVEVTVRKSRSWDERVLTPDYDIVTTSDCPPREIFDEEVRQATSSEYMGGAMGGKARTGYALMDRAWDLDWEAMTFAHELVAANQAAFSDFRLKVLVHSEAYGWCIWDEGQEGGESMEGEREKIVRFKNVWTGMGREGMFFKWIEVVQESGVVEWAEVERKQELRTRAKKMIEDEGLNFDDVLDAIGGWAAWPGLE